MGMNLIYCIQRWIDTNIPSLLKNIATSVFITAFVCFALPSDVFDEFSYASTNTCIFALLMCAIWSGFFNSIALFYSESSYMIDDLQKFLTIGDYMVANIIIQVMLCMIEAIFSTIVFFIYYRFDMTGLVFEKNILIDYSITFFMVMFSSDMLGFMLGMLVDKITSAMTLIPIVLIIQMLFSGCLFELDGPMKAFTKFTIAKWGYSSLGSLADINSYRIDGVKKDLFELSSSHIINCWGNMFLLAILFTVIAVLILYIKLNNRRD